MSKWLWHTLRAKPLAVASGSRVCGVVGKGEARHTVRAQGLMARRPRDEDFERRLTWEIIRDAKPEEQSIGWYYYLEEHLRFPFQARCIGERPASPLRVGDVVDVREMPADEVCEHEMFVNIAWRERMLAVPLIQLAGVDVAKETAQAIQDWHTWVERGYVL